jgi:hypothetical protein
MKGIDVLFLNFSKEGIFLDHLGFEMTSQYSELKKLLKNAIKEAP